MDESLQRVFDAQNGVATAAQIREHVTRRHMEALADCGVIERIWTGIYCDGEPDINKRLAGLDLSTRTTVPVCLQTAAAIYGFDVTDDVRLHVLNPPRRQLRPVDGLVVHRRDAAPLHILDGRLITTPAWTAVELARSVARPRALAVLDAALRSGQCSRGDMWRAALEQKGRRGIVDVRNLLPIADARAESAMESEARLGMIDAGLPLPELQFPIVDGDGVLRRVDFAWPDQRVAAEYDGVDWHSEPDAMRRDRRRQTALMEVGWMVIPIVFDDVRHHAFDFTRRIRMQLNLARAA